MRDFNEFLIENDQRVFNEIFGKIAGALGMGGPEWVGYLKKLSATPEGPVAQQMLKMFTKGVDPKDYMWVKQNQNDVFRFLQKHRNNLEGMGVNVDGLIKKLGIYDPTDLAIKQSGNAGWLGNRNVSAHDNHATANVKSLR
jgi:hypothetical protein